MTNEFLPFTYILALDATLHLCQTFELEILLFHYGYVFDIYVFAGTRYYCYTSMSSNVWRSEKSPIS